MTGSTGGPDDALHCVRRFLIVALISEQPGAPVTRVALRDKTDLVIGRAAAREVEWLPGGAPLAVRIPDRCISTSHARIEHESGGCFIIDSGSKNGTRVNGVEVKRRLLRDGDVIEVGGSFLVFREDAVQASRLVSAARERTEHPADRARALTTVSPRMEDTLAAMQRIAESDRAVLITGETGTGKELTARAVHELSKRPGPFVAVNCGAVPETLIESTFFGVVRGAYSGANEARDGWVRSAEGGTLFLDEVAELTATSQAALLRVLQEREIVPVGGTRPIRVDVRFVAATHQDLRARVKDGLFREDLYARLAAHEVQLLPLRGRVEDLGLLAGCTLAGAKHTAGIRKAAVRALFAYEWPRNVRELDNALAHAIRLAGGDPIDLVHLPETIHPAVLERPALPHVDITDRAALRECLIELYKQHNGSVSAVARAMGKARTQIQRWNKRFAIDPAAFTSE
jgi:transcriptional regulator with PAS, ATPase and Fis domain